MTDRDSNLVTFVELSRIGRCDHDLKLFNTTRQEPVFHLRMHRNSLAAGLCSLSYPLAGFKGRPPEKEAREGKEGREETRGCILGSREPK